MKKKLLTAIIAILMIPSLVVGASAADADIEPYAFGTQRFTTTIRVVVPEYRHSSNIVFSQFTVPFDISYDVRYDLNTGKISNVSLANVYFNPRETVFSSGLAEVHLIDVQYFDECYEIVNNGYSIRFELVCVGNVTYSSTITGQKIPLKMITFCESSIPITVTPATN